jgi:pilus assembly protein CpaB
MNRSFTSAVLVALIVTGAIVLYILHRGTTVHPPPPTPKTRYVVTATNMQADQVIRAENLRFIDWPVTAPIPGAFTATEPLIGRATLYPLAEGEPIIERQLAAPGSGIGITLKIPNGMRAISLRSDEIVGVAGFLLPGTYVDVLVTLHTEKSPDPVTFTVLQDAQVIAAGQKIDPDPEEKPTTVTVVTLLVKPEDAERVVLASSQGAVHFVLRNGTDRQEYKGPPAILSRLSGIAPPVPEKVASVPGVKRYVVETILGTKPRTDDF